MKTKIFMSNGKEYKVSYDIETLNEMFLTHKDGSLINGMVYFSGFALNPSHIASLEEVKAPQKIKVSDKASIFGS
ncbi:hypothetical protein [Paenibacillus sp. UMB4589-SE434]|uniref:hypothetical protein n=1 Tax=Paenibacillus sp. UMB4589-SE434 TaxID=3046314 RepID=UPI00254CA1D8|nr:hypothetical protein [Paenibacillus sp. UMB4589-SE434]MDK8182100.1 hypothetical protein [Paenibacillus sp. UMB4589-SE434]